MPLKFSKLILVFFSSYSISIYIIDYLFSKKMIINYFLLKDMNRIKLNYVVFENIFGIYNIILNKLVKLNKLFTERI